MPKCPSAAQKFQFLSRMGNGGGAGGVEGASRREGKKANCGSGREKAEEAAGESA